LAKQVKALSEMQYVVENKGQSLAWSPYRYAVYLHWMRRTASMLQCAPDELELSLFGRRYLAE
jgi:hypothetical protein